MLRVWQIKTTNNLIYYNDYNGYFFLISFVYLFFFKYYSGHRPNLKSFNLNIVLIEKKK